MKIFIKLVSKWRKVDDLEPEEKVGEELDNEISDLIDGYIILRKFEKIEDFVKNGYKLSDQQLNRFIYDIMKTYLDDKFPMSLVEYVAVDNSDHFNKILQDNVLERSHRDVWYHLISNSDDIVGIITNKSLTYLSRYLDNSYQKNQYEQIEQIITERKNSRHQELLNKKFNTQTVMSWKLKESLKHIPASGYIDTIQENLTKINVESLSVADRAELKEIVDIILPDVIMKYAAIDKTMMTYKNSQNESIETLLQDSLSHIEQKINRYRQATEDAKIKEFKIAVKMSK